MDNDEIDLSPLIRHNAELPFPISPTSFPAEPPQVQQRPISKRRGKKRSSRACSSCRTRKVRCNIVAHGAPCSNCRHDEIDCVLPLSRRQRYGLNQRKNLDFANNICVGQLAREQRKASKNRCADPKEATGEPTAQKLNIAIQHMSPANQAHRRS